MAVKTCPACGKQMNADLSTCPWCGASAVDATVVRPSSPGAMQASGAAPDTVPCPFCQEPIQRAAVKCRWCGEAVGPGAAARPAGPPSVPVYNPPPLAPAAPPGTVPLVLGIIGLAGGFFLCLPILLSPIAWVTGSNYERECRAMGVEPDGAGKAGKVLGIIGTVFLLLGVLGFFGLIALVVLAGATSSGTPY